MNEIIEYVTKTPHNTNPAVLESIINQNMNRVLDLDKYGISELLMGLFDQGGGQVIRGGFNQFWADVKENNPDTIQFTMNNVKAVCKNPVLFLEIGTDKLYGISFEVLIGSEVGLNRVSIAFVSDWTDDLIPDGLIIQMAIQELTAQS